MATAAARVRCRGLEAPEPLREGIVPGARGCGAGELASRKRSFSGHVLKGCQECRGAARGCLETHLETKCSETCSPDGFADTPHACRLCAHFDPGSVARPAARRTAGCRVRAALSGDGVRRPAGPAVDRSSARLHARGRYACRLAPRPPGALAPPTHRDRRGPGRQGCRTAVPDRGDRHHDGGRLVFHVFGALAEFERSLIGERARAGLDAAGKAVAGALFQDPSIPIAEIARQVGVSRATLYKYFPGGRRR